LNAKIIDAFELCSKCAEELADRDDPCSSFKFEIKTFQHK
jgi:hypothetical protein